MILFLLTNFILLFRYVIYLKQSLQLSNVCDLFELNKKLKGIIYYY